MFDKKLHCIIIIEKGLSMAGRPVSRDSQVIGSRMKQILKQLDVTQESAAFRLGLASQSSLHSYLSGRTEIPLNVINKFCSEFNVPVASLFANDDTIANAGNDLVLDIMLAIALTGEQRKKLVKDFLGKNCCDADRIKSTLSALHAINSEMFIKRK